jgi:hypothetical protein
MKMLRVFLAATLVFAVVLTGKPTFLKADNGVSDVRVATATESVPAMQEAKQELPAEQQPLVIGRGIALEDESGCYYETISKQIAQKDAGGNWTKAAQQFVWNFDKGVCDDRPAIVIPQRIVAEYKAVNFEDEDTTVRVVEVLTDRKPSENAMPREPRGDGKYLFYLITVRQVLDHNQI